MEAAIRRKESTVENPLLDEATSFNFFQAVRLIQQLTPGEVAVGYDSKPSSECLRFSSSSSFVFEPSAIQSIEQTREARYEMQIAFIGFLGKSGILPDHYSELIQERLAAKDTAFSEFLDLFLHRLISFFYRAWEKPRLFLQATGAHSDAFASYLRSFLGLTTAGLQDRLNFSDTDLLYYAGSIAQKPCSAETLRRLLRHFFNVPVDIEPFIGRWLVLEKDETTRLGIEDSGETLGDGIAVGRRFWDLQNQYRVCIGPVCQSVFDSFLPGGKNCQPIIDLTGFLVGPTFDVELQLILAGEDVIPLHLAASSTAKNRLGWNSWLNPASNGPDRDDTILRFRYQHQ